MDTDPRRRPRSPPARCRPRSKIYVTPDSGARHRVPLREIHCTERRPSRRFRVYDTTGPYTDPTATIDVEQGPGRARARDWVLARGGVEEYQGRDDASRWTTAMSPASISRAHFQRGQQPLRALDGRRSRNSNARAPASSPRR